METRADVVKRHAENDTVVLIAEATHMEVDAGGHVVIGELRKWRERTM